MRIDERRDLLRFEIEEEAIEFSVKHFIETAKRSIAQRGKFCVALSGGATPKAIYRELSKRPSALDWSRVWLFWSDERSVLPTHQESNYRMAMEAGLASLPIREIFRMVAEENIAESARAYETLLQANPLDMVMLGMGSDGHTASLFPDTEGVHEKSRLVIENFVPKLNSWRLSLTLPCINAAEVIAIYVMGVGKSEMVAKALGSDETIPSQRIGTKSRRALWIVDREAGKLL